MYYITKTRPKQYAEIFSALKKGKFHWEIIDSFDILAQNIDCGFTDAVPNIWIKNEKKSKSQFNYI